MARLGRCHRNHATVRDDPDFDSLGSGSRRLLLIPGRAHGGSLAVQGATVMQADSRVDEYIGTLPEWQQAICQQVRELAHAADPEVEETIKRSVQPYFVLQGNICALLATKDHVNVFIYDPTVADPHGIINQGHGNATAKAVQIYRAKSSTGPRCWRCSGPSSPITGRAAGGASRRYRPPRRRSAWSRDPRALPVHAPDDGHASAARMPSGGGPVVRPHLHQVGALADRDLAAVGEADRAGGVAADQLHAVDEPDRAVGRELEHGLQRA